MVTESCSMSLSPWPPFIHTFQSQEHRGVQARKVRRKSKKNGSGLHLISAFTRCQIGSGSRGKSLVQLDLDISLSYRLEISYVWRRIEKSRTLHHMTR